MTAEIRDLLLRAAGRADLAWCQGALTTDDTTSPNFDPDACPVCAQGAIRWALSGKPFGNVVVSTPADALLKQRVFNPALVTLDDVIWRSLDPDERARYDTYSLHQQWNDRPGRTKEEVVEMLRRAADAAAPAPEAAA
jgi:hypothetical protein